MNLNLLIIAVIILEKPVVSFKQKEQHKACLIKQVKTELTKQVFLFHKEDLQQLTLVKCLLQML